MSSKKRKLLTITAVWCFWWAMGFAPAEAVPQMKTAASVMASETEIDAANQVPLQLAGIEAEGFGLNRQAAYRTKRTNQITAYPGPVQVFDVEMGKIIKTIPNDARFQQMALEWTKTVTGLAPQMSPGQGYSYVIRVPLAAQTAIRSGSIHFNADNLFLFLAKDKPPLLLAFNSDNKPYLFLFRSNTDDFVKRIALPL
ncbi:hypothetical protein A7K91_04090 [Paenibacillus oryzae]|uniref:DUF4309 domain-containing protein n=1 Tax=Paenibacillus oryzae TaxID=1844972 RepID=A0A1A5YGR0_9BACL|nr:hypothetical protein [Paenibacillus oryzae]OBR64772.1 hypothetical protein A7K91_04090 [Paenibacillus oryzae]